MFEKLRDRYLILIIIFIIFGAVVVYRLYELQLVQGDNNYAQAHKVEQAGISVNASRGKILDINNVIIADNQTVYTVQITNTNKTEDLNAMLLNLVLLFEKNGDSYNKSITKYLQISPLKFGSSLFQKSANWQNETDSAKKDKYKETFLSAVKNEILANVSAQKDIASDLRGINNADDLYKYFYSKYKIDKKYTENQAYKIMCMRFELSIGGFFTSQQKIVELSKHASKNTYLVLSDSYMDYPGVFTTVNPSRIYNDNGLLGNVLGYIGGIDSNQLAQPQFKGYDMDSIVGKAGIELSAEKYLKGQKGYRPVTFNSDGQIQSEEYTKEPVPGEDVTLTVDMKLQKIAMDGLKTQINVINSRKGEKGFKGDANAGSVVAMNVNTGEILAMANYPNYSSNIFLPDANKNAQNQISNLYKDKNAPFWNRAIASRYEPGSTFKPLVALASLGDNVISPGFIYNDSKGYTTIGNRKFYCLEGGHGYEGLTKALATSCNTFFETVGYMTGIDKLDKWAKLLGLGEKTGVDLPGEVKGYRSSKDTKKLLQPDDPTWRPADTAQSSIGQFLNAYTPIELVNYISVIANGGKLFTPHIIKKVSDGSGKTVYQTPQSYKTVNIRSQNLAIVREGMVEVANSADGTAASVFTNPLYKVACKTGTAETTSDQTKSNNSVFVCYAPADKPEIAIAIVIEHGVWGRNSAPIAKGIFDSYFASKKK
jgi:penicillin-binding protein 2